MFSERWLQHSSYLYIGESLPQTQMPTGARQGLNVSAGLMWYLGDVYSDMESACHPLPPTQTNKSDLNLWVVLEHCPPNKTQMWAKWWPVVTFRNTLWGSRRAKGRSSFHRGRNCGSEDLGTWLILEGQHIRGLSGFSASVTDYGCDMYHRSFPTHDRQSTKSMNDRPSPSYFKDFSGLMWLSHTLCNCSLKNNCSFQKALSTWGLTTDVRLVLCGDFPFSVSCLLSQLSSEASTSTALKFHLGLGGPAPLPGRGSRWAQGWRHRTFPVRFWDAFAMTLLGFKQ